MRESVGILIAVKGVWDFGRVWMRRVRGLLIVGRKFLEAEGFGCGG